VVGEADVEQFGDFRQLRKGVGANMALILNELFGRCPHPKGEIEDALCVNESVYNSISSYLPNRPGNCNRCGNKCDQMRREMSRGFFAKLTPEQQQAALEYRGPENIGGQTITHTFTDEELDRVLDRVVAWLLGGCCPDATEAAVRADASTDLTQALDQCQKALALLIDPEAIRKSRVQDGWAAAVAAEARARSALEKARR
jgi:hypothetical protein